jgi:hypothetical protein
MSDQQHNGSGRPPHRHDDDQDRDKDRSDDRRDLGPDEAEETLPDRDTLPDRG